MNNILTQYKGIVVLVLLFGVLNLALWGGQELWHYEDTQKINALEQDLKSEEATFTKLGSTIATDEAELESQEQNLELLDKIGAVEMYNNGVDTYNTRLASYKNNVARYNSMLDSYNQKVDETNTLNEKSGSRWYLIPIPLSSKHKGR